MRRRVTSRDAWVTFGATLSRNKRSLAGILVVVFVIHATHALQPLELRALDVWQRLLEERPAGFVRVVAIDDADFATLFGGRMPLQPAVIAKLLDVIAAARPLLIGVDIKTSSSEFASLAERTDWGPVVWGRDGRAQGHLVVPDAILGGRTVLPPGRAGVALAAVDSDDVVRRIPRMFDTRAGPRSSFHWEIVRAACESGLRAPGCRANAPAVDGADSAPLVNLYPQRLQLRPIPASALLQIGGQLPPGVGPEALSGRVVLLGGTFREGRDAHRTPVGELSGVETWAHAIETELRNEGVEEVGAIWLTLADAAIALVIMWLHHFVGGRAAFLTIIFVAPLAMVGLSLILFRAAGLLLTFVPVVVAILIHQLWDDYRQAATSVTPGVHV